MTTQITFILFFVLFISFSNIITKVTLKNGTNVSTFTAFHNIAGGLIVLPLVFFDHRLPGSTLPWVFLTIGVITSVLGDYYYFKSMAIEDISVLTLVFRLRFVLVFIFGTILFHESTTSSKTLAMILITIGSLFTGYREGRFRFSKGVILALISNVFLGTMFIVDKKVASSISIPLYNFINFLTSGLFFLALSLKQHKTSLKHTFQNVNLLPAVVAGALLSLASLCRRYSFHLGEISFATPLLNLSVVLTMFLGIVVLKERDRLWQKIAGLGIIITGAVLLG